MFLMFFSKMRNYCIPNLGGKAYYVFAMMYIVTPIPKQLVGRLTHMKAWAWAWAFV
jgi:hypothetical protein